MSFIILVPLLVALVFFLYLKGCFITIAEYKLCGDDTNIIDIYILMFGEDINEHTRYKYTLVIVGIYFTIVSSILYIKNTYL